MDQQYYEYLGDPLFYAPSVAITDGGGLVSASLDPLHGPESIARFLIGIY